MDIAAMSAAREQLGQQEDEAETLESEGEPEEVAEGGHVEVLEEEALEHGRDEYEEIDASPPHPGRNRFNLTNIGEESSMLEESRLEESILEESGAEAEQVEHLEMLQEEDSQEEREGGTPEQSFRRRSRSALTVRQSTGQARQSTGQTRLSTGPVGQARQSLGQSGSDPASQTRQSSGRVGSVRQSLSQVFRQEAGSSSDLTPPAQGRLSRPPLRDLSVPSPSPQVDILKTQRHPAVVLSDLVTMNHPALPSQYGQQPSSTPLLPHPTPSHSPAFKRTSAPIIAAEEFPEDPSESFLEQMCDADPLEGPSWLFASVHKKKRRSSAVRKLSAVWSDSERASTMGSSGRATSSLDSSDIDMSGASSREVSGYVLDRDLLETAVVNATPEVSLDTSTVEATPARPAQSSTSSVATSTNSVTAFEEDMELTRTESLQLEKELNSSNQENNPMQLVSSRSIDESNLSISVSQTPRTPLSSLTYTDPSGEVVNFNPRTDTGVTVAGLREAQILLSNVGMVDNMGRSTTPYKLSECYIDLSPGRSMSLDQLFSLGLRAGISSPTANSPKLKKRKHASEAPTISVTPPSKRGRMTDLPRIRQKGVRASLDMIPPPNMKNLIVNRASIESPSKNSSPCKLPVPSVKVTRCTADQETIANAGNGERIDTETVESSDLAETRDKCDDVLNSDEASHSDEVVVFDKNKKKSVMPSFVLLEKSPIKTFSALTDNVDEDSGASDEILPSKSVVEIEIESEVNQEVNEESPVEANVEEVPNEPERARRKNRVDYAVLLNGDEDDGKTRKRDTSEKQPRKVNEPPSKNTSRLSTNNLKDADIISLLSEEESPETVGGEEVEKEVQAISVDAKESKKPKTTARLSKAPKKLSKSAKQRENVPEEEAPEVTSVESDDEPESVEPQVKEAAVAKIPVDKSKKKSRKVSQVVIESVPAESRKASRSTGKTGEISTPIQEDEVPSLEVVTSSSRGSSIGPSTEASEGRGGRSRRGAQVSYKELPLGKKLRQGDAGSTSVYSGLKPVATTKSRKSGKKK
eukprot:TRINITY_DN16251_c0_g1_i1.p1 TRINITY_DN16251_c0_g1~~TRINITY_DN16251_c0_g1_i1.p1  ORF type:complete len:1069 (-),score=415.63 TRINITY_DN16251_c0_g1_i1:309-3422(-)